MRRVSRPVLAIGVMLVDLAVVGHARTLSDLGPPLTHMEVSEDEFFPPGEPYGLRELLAASRPKGAEIILMPGQDRPPSWQS